MAWTNRVTGVDGAGAGVRGRDSADGGRYPSYGRRPHGAQPSNQVYGMQGKGAIFFC